MANARLSKIKGFVQDNEIAALSCENGKDDLADGQEVSLHLSDHLEPEIFSSFAPGDHRDSQLPWELPGQGQVQLEDQGARQKGGAHLV